MNAIALDAYDIKIELDGNGGGTIHSDIGRETCPHCSQEDCYFNCDESQTEDSQESEEDARNRLCCNAAIDGIESLVLACACAGVKVDSPAFLEALETAVEAVGNNF